MSSKQVDERVVSMQFDSKKFEERVNSTIGIIDKLSNSLNFKGAEKGFEKIDAASKKVDMSPVSDSVEKVGLKFDALFTIADQTLRRVTDAALSAGKRIVKSLTIDPIMTGFQEYETQINSVQTILANTESKGSTLQDVNNALAELNTYADKTIYNFTEMTRNIGTFTAAGVDLKTSVAAIKGIANLAAVSGSTSQQASTAMYQLSQALSSGTVKLMDWNSVVNAGMGGQVFQDALKETARVHNIAIDDMIKKNGSFRETLQEGWLTSEILTETLSKFTGDLSESQLKAMGYTDEQIKSIVKMGQTANDAATKVKTFTQLFDTLQEAAQSGWTKSWELLVGDFGEAKELLTEISDLVGGIIGASGDKRNEMLMGGLATGWKQLLDQGINDAAGFEEMVSNVAKEHGVDIASMINDETTFQDVLKKSLKEGTLTSDVLGESITKFNEKVSKMSGEELEAAGYTKDHVEQLKQLNEKVQNGTISMEEFSKLIVRPSGRELLIESLWNCIKGIQSVITPVKDALEEVFPSMTGEQLYKLIEGIRDFTSKLILTEDQAGKLKSTFKGVFSVIKVGVDIVKSIASGCVKLIGAILPIGNGLLDVTASVGDFLSGLGEIASKVISIDGIFGGLASILRTVATGIGGLFSALAGGVDKCGGFLGMLKSLVDWIGQLVDKVTVATPGDSIFDTLFNFVNGGIFTAIGVWVAKLIKGFGDIVDNAGGFVESITDILGGVGDALEGFTQTLKARALKDIAISIGILAAALFVIASIDPVRLTVALGGMGALIQGLILSLKSLDKIGEGGKFKGVGKLTATMMGISTALLILSAALKIMGSMTWQEMLVGLGGMVIGLQALVKALSMLPEGEVNKSAKTLKKLASSLVVLAIALKIMGSMSWKEMGVGLISMGSGLGALVGALHLLPKDMAGKSNGIMKLSGSLMILAVALKIMGSMSWKEMGVGLISMGTGLGALIGALHLLPKDTAGKAGSVLLLSSSMIVLGAAMKIFASIQWDEMVRGFTGIGVGLGILVGALHLLPKDVGGKVASILLLSTSMVILGTALKIMGSMSWEQIGKGLASILGTLVLLGVAGYVLAPVSGVLLAIGGAIALLGIGCLAAGAGLTLLATGITALAAAIVGSVGIILAGANELVGVFTTIILSLVTAIVSCIPAITNGLLQLLVSVIGGLAQYTPQLVDSLFDFLIGLIDAISARLPELIQSGVNLLMSFFQGVIDALGNIDVTVLIQGLTAVGLFTALIIALSAITPFIPGAMLAVLGMGAIVAEVGLVLAAIGALAQIPGLEWLISEGGDFLQTVGTAIGQFLGGIVGGFAEGALSTLPEIGLKLSEFMTNAAPFISGAQMISPGTLEGVKSLVEIILLLTAADILDGLTSWLTGGSSLTDFGEQLLEFGPQIAAFAESVKGINPQAVTAASSSGKMLAEMAKAIPSDWGNNNITNFGSQIKDFASSIVSFSDTIGGNGESIKSSAATVKEVVSSLSTVVSSNTGAIDSFKQSLIDLAQNGFTGFSDTFANAGDSIGLTIGSFITTVTTKITAERDSIYESFRSVGAYAVEGFVKGINENTFKASAEAAAMGKAALIAAQEELGIESPSVVFKEEVGKYIVQGVAEGIKSDMSAEEAAKKKAQNIVDAFKKELDKQDVNSNIAEVEYDIWKNSSEGLLASDDVKNSKALSFYQGELGRKWKKEQLAYSEWQETIANGFKSGSKEERDAYLKYKQAVKETQSIQTSISQLKNTVDEKQYQDAEQGIANREKIHSLWLKTDGKYASDEELDKKETEKLNADLEGVRSNLAKAIAEHDKILAIPEGTYDADTYKQMKQDAWDKVHNYKEQEADIINSLANIEETAIARAYNKLSEERSRNDAELSLWLKTDGKYASDAVKDSKIIATYQKNFNSIQAEIARREKKLVDITKEYGESSEEYLAEVDNIRNLKSESADIWDQIQGVYQEQTNEQIEAMDLANSNLNAQYQLWEKTVGRNATVAEKNVAKLGMLSGQLQNQSAVVQIARSEWQKAEREYGKSSDEAQRKYNEYLSEQLELANLQSEITDINESTVEKQKAAKYDYNDYIKNYEKFYEMNGMTKEQLKEDAKLISGYDPSNTLTKMIDKTNNMFESLTSSDSYKSMMDGFSNMGTSCVEAVSQAIDSQHTVIKDSASTMLKEVSNVLEDGYDEWVAIGKDLVQGFINGIKSMIPLAVIAAKALATATTEATRSTFDEHSPSRVFAEIGEFAVLGLVNGLLDNASLAKNAASELSNETIEGLKSTIQAISEFIDSDVDTQPTIRPVLDLSEVSAGTARLNSMFSRTQAIKAGAGLSKDGSEEIQNGDNNPKSGNSYQFNQYNYSPKPLSRSDIYRQTRNQFTALKGVLG